MDKSTVLNRRAIRRYSILFISIILACAVFLCWKAHYGFVPNDEPFMISLGHRFLKGDIPITHEWYRAQMIGIIYLPFIWIYTNVFGSTEGLVLFCRYVFVIWWIFTGAVLYRRLNQYGHKISLIAITAFYLYVPFDIMSITYNAVSLSCLLLFFSYFLVKGNIVLDYINGFVLAIAVIAYPLLIIVALLYGIAVIVSNISGRCKNYNIFNVRKLIRVIIPCLVGFTVLITYIITNSNIENFFTGLSEVVRTNSAANRSIVLLAKNLISTFPFDFSLGLVVLIFSLFDKKRFQRTAIYFSVQSVIFFLSIIYLLLGFMYLNVIMFPLCILGLQAFILNKKKNWNLFICLWITGVLFAIVCYLSSDTGNMAIANGMVISTIASCVFLGDFYKEFHYIGANTNKKVICVLFSLAFALQIGSEFIIRTIRSYKDNLLPELIYQIPSGAAKGIITSKNNYEKYTTQYNDIQSINKDIHDKNSFLSIGLSPYAYLNMDCDYSTYSVWVYTNNKPDYSAENKQLTEYLQLFPNKMPDVIYSNLEYNHLKDEIKCIDYSNYKTIELSSGLWLVRN